MSGAATLATVLAAAVAVALAMLALGLGELLGRRTLRGSCGSARCACDPDARACEAFEEER